MKLINLNIMGGEIHDPLLGFIEANKDETDIFCFQEVLKSDRSVITPAGYRSNILGELEEILSDFKYLFSPNYHGRDFENIVDYQLSHGPAVFWKKSLMPIEIGKIFTHYTEDDVREFFGSNKPDVPRNFQYLIFEKYIVMNFHGYWAPAPKTDTPQRLEQSEKLISFVKKYNLPAVIAGDFNLAMGTKSVAMFENQGFRNLVKESKAETTRSSFYPIRWRATDKYADYIFVSPEIEVKDFKVLPDEVSDHLPLCLEFKI